MATSWQGIAWKVAQKSKSAYPPRATSVSDQPAVAPRREFALEGRVLLVEDEEAVLEFERDVLVGSGAQVVTAMSADDARSRVRAEMFDAVVINGRMPGGWNAPDVYRWLKESCPAWKST